MLLPQNVSNTSKLKHLFWIGLALILVATWPVVAGEDGDSEILTEVNGQVVKVGNFGFGLVPDDEPGTRYAPVEPLAEEFQQDGLKVRFSGEVGSADDMPARGGRGGRRWGTPLTVTHIEKIATESPDSNAVH